MVGRHQGFVRANFTRVTTVTKESVPPGIAQQWPTLLMIKLGRITLHRFTEALEPFGIRPRHVAALIELRDRGELTQQSLCGQLHLDPTNLVAILNELEERGYATRRRDPQDRRRHLVEVSKKGVAVIEKVSKVMDEVEADLLKDLEPAEREQLERLLASIWERSGGYEAWSQVPADADDQAA
ncbi:MAG: MarR family transcriptional regulator, transcriptional regulator for hemolysin [Thermoleophilaceae bacterium]|nr:MarR family transcriptional regulator, transcriptional regulator for hemolysin [Thermoleophilaceae bacterium]